jgi:hypothetical protein
MRNINAFIVFIVSAIIISCKEKLPETIAQNKCPDQFKISNALDSVCKEYIQRVLPVIKSNSHFFGLIISNTGKDSSVYFLYAFNNTRMISDNGMTIMGITKVDTLPLVIMTYNNNLFENSDSLNSSYFSLLPKEVQFPKNAYRCDDMITYKCVCFKSGKIKVETVSWRMFCSTPKEIEVKN